MFNPIFRATSEQLTLPAMNRSYILLAVIFGALVVVLLETAWIRARHSPPSSQSAPATDTASIEASVPAAPLQSVSYEPHPDASPAELAAWIRPREGEEQWAKVNWFGTLEHAQSVAEQTNRPVFLWVTNQPFDRC
jgi:hypothetical protein